MSLILASSPLEVSDLPNPDIDSAVQNLKAASVYQESLAVFNSVQKKKALAAVCAYEAQRDEIGSLLSEFSINGCFLNLGWQIAEIGIRNAREIAKVAMNYWHKEKVSSEQKPRKKAKQENDASREYDKTHFYHTFWKYGTASLVQEAIALNGITTEMNTSEIVGILASYADPAMRQYKARKRKAETFDDGER